MATKKQTIESMDKAKTLKKKKKKGTRLLILALITLDRLWIADIFVRNPFRLPLSSRDGQRAGSAKREKWLVTLYFSDANERFLAPEKRQIPKEKDTAGQARELVKALLDGSKTKLVNTFPPEHGTAKCQN